MCYLVIPMRNCHQPIDEDDDDESSIAESKQSDEEQRMTKMMILSKTINVESEKKTVNRKNKSKRPKSQTALMSDMV